MAGARSSALGVCRRDMTGIQPRGDPVIGGEGRLVGASRACEAGDSCNGCESSSMAAHGYRGSATDRAMTGRMSCPPVPPHLPQRRLAGRATAARRAQKQYCQVPVVPGSTSPVDGRYVPDVDVGWMDGSMRKTVVEPSRHPPLAAVDVACPWRGRHPFIRRPALHCLVCTCPSILSGSCGCIYDISRI